MNALERLTVARCPQPLQQPVDEHAHLGVALAAGQVERVEVGVARLGGALRHTGPTAFCRLIDKPHHHQSLLATIHANIVRKCGWNVHRPASLNLRGDG